MLYFGRVGSSWGHHTFFGSSWGEKVITPKFIEILSIIMLAYFCFLLCHAALPLLHKTKKKL
jgi:hypothetical protein